MHFAIQLVFINLNFSLGSAFQTLFCVSAMIMNEAHGIVLSGSL